MGDREKATGAGTRPHRRSFRPSLTRKRTPRDSRYRHRPHHACNHSQTRGRLFLSRTIARSVDPLSRERKLDTPAPPSRLALQVSQPRPLSRSRSQPRTYQSVSLGTSRQLSRAVRRRCANFVSRWRLLIGSSLSPPELRNKLTATCYLFIFSSQLVGDVHSSDLAHPFHLGPSLSLRPRRLLSPAPVVLSSFRSTSLSTSLSPRSHSID